MIVALFPHEGKKNSLPLAKKICSFLLNAGVKVFAEEKKASKIGAQKLSIASLKKIDFLIALGGDGTILKLSQKYHHLNIPILGINLGHLGFLADIPLSDIFPSLNDLIKGNYNIEKRIMLQGQVNKTTPFHVTNDIVLHRGASSHLIEMEITVDNTYFNTFVADGIIVSTPNGSTAYSLSAGGPIIDPKMDAIVITPICPHTISNRPIVLNSRAKITIKYLSIESVQIVGDGLNYQTIKQGHSIAICKSSYSFQLVKLKRHNYFATLRAKLAWSGKLT